MSLEESESFVSDPPEGRVLRNTFKQTRLFACICLVSVKPIPRARNMHNLDQKPADAFVIDGLYGFHMKLQNVKNHIRRIMIFDAPVVSIACRIQIGIERHDPL